MNIEFRGKRLRSSEVGIEGGCEGMTNEEIEFLQNLQKELNEQPNDGNADPVFWVIGDYRWEPAPLGYEDELRVVDGEGIDFTIEAFISLLQSEEDSAKIVEDVEYYSENDRIEQIIDLLHAEGCGIGSNFRLMGVCKKFYIQPDTFFVTKEEAKRHLKLNHYHYTREAHTYAMTAWRSPVVSRLWKILRTCDFEKLKAGAANEQN